MESEGLVLETASALFEICEELGLPLIFKSSFDKANRTSSQSFRSLGLAAGMEILQRVKDEIGLPVTSDVHEAWQVNEVKAVLDLLQVPAFLCRQTDLLHACGASGRPTNIKKGQFLSPGEMRYAVNKVSEHGGDVMLTERGTFFGYHDLVVDLRSLVVMREFAPVLYDVTHSVQQPGALDGRSGGARWLAPPLARAAVSVGLDGVFIETHPDPDTALSDGPNMIPLSDMRGFLMELKSLHEITPSRLDQ